MLTHGSLFAGIGGFDLGAERAGIPTLWQVEKDLYCRNILENPSQCNPFRLGRNLEISIGDHK